MAAANMKAVKLRIRSIQNTMQITKAMQLVAASKLRKAKELADQVKPYFETLHETLSEIASGNSDFMSPYTKISGNEKWCYVVIAGDRGLAGGYNANLFRYVTEETKGREYTVLPIGKKAVEYFRVRHIPILTEAFAEVADLTVSDCFTIADLLCREFREGSFGHVAVVYTEFVSMLSQVPAESSLLPLADFNEKPQEKPQGARNLILYEPDSETVFNEIVPKYLAGLLYGAVCESVASELAARRTAMEAATDNAGEMIEKLSLYYNRARQAGITQEITEIVAGAEQSM